MDPPEKGPAARILAPTMSPIAKGAMVPRSPFFGSAAVAYTVYTRPKVIIISNIIPSNAPTPAARPWVGVACLHRIKFVQFVDFYQLMGTHIYSISTGSKRILVCRNLYRSGDEFH
jgi:hypothetical protein